MAPSATRMTVFSAVFPYHELRTGPEESGRTERTGHPPVKRKIKIWNNRKLKNWSDFGQDDPLSSFLYYLLSTNLSAHRLEVFVSQDAAGDGGHTPACSARGEIPLTSFRAK